MRNLWFVRKKYEFTAKRNLRITLLAFHHLLGTTPNHQAELENLISGNLLHCSHTDGSLTALLWQSRRPFPRSKPQFYTLNTFSCVTQGQWLIMIKTKVVSMNRILANSLSTK